MEIQYHYCLTFILVVLNYENKIFLTVTFPLYIANHYITIITVISHLTSYIFQDSHNAFIKANQYLFVNHSSLEYFAHNSVMYSFIIRLST